MKNNNTANQHVRSTLQDSSYCSCQYDSFGQVASGKKRWADGTLVAGQQFQYAFDGIGNPTATKAAGDENGANLRSASYSPIPALVVMLKDAQPACRAAADQALAEIRSRPEAQPFKPSPE